MNPCRGTAKLGTMKSKNYEKETALSTNADGSCYKIYVKGHLDHSWSDWLGGLEIELINDGGMILTGYIEDQASLMGILNKLYNLNLAILSLSKTSQKK